MNTNLPIKAAIVIASLMMGGVGAANAATYTFSQLHSDEKADVNDQLSVNVTEYGSNAVSFTFYNTTELKGSAALTPEYSGEAEISREYTQASVKSYDSISSYETASESGSLSEASSTSKSDDGSQSEYSGSGKEGQNSSITDIYLAGTEGLLVLPGKITAESAGVSFSTGADPKNLPGGKPYGFVAAVGADSNAPVQPNGVNSAKEYVTWTFALESGTTYKDVIGALDSGTMRIGLHVPGSAGGSASFLNNFSGAAVPLPASIWLMFGALGSLGFISRRARRGGGNSAASALSPAG